LAKYCPSLSSVIPKPIRFGRHIVSVGQTGADRGALDSAIAHGHTHGSYRQHTRRNVLDSDGTLIVNCGELDGGTLANHVFAQRLKKPSLVVQLDHGVTANVVAQALEWVRQYEIKTLNVAGPRENKRPGIYRLTRELLDQVDAANQSEIHQTYGSRYPGANTAF
jgi:hypothetical protein